jgi:putative serine protease PepD
VVLIQHEAGLGSGVVYDEQGHIVTNAHVVGEATEFMVMTADGDRFEATLVGSFAPNDLAVIEVEGGDLQPATFAPSAELEVGDIVMAVGNPLGLQSSVTEGIISALGRTLTGPDRAALPNLIQTSAAINPGNSGGALVDLDGRVVGVPTLGARDPNSGGAAPGIGFAIPSDSVTSLADQLIESGRVTASGRAYLGIEAAEVRGAQGVLVFAVQPGSPAAEAGIEPGVLITSIAGQPTPAVAALSTVLANQQPGETVTVETLSRDGDTGSVEVTLGELPG